MHHDAQKLTTLGRPLASSALEKPGTGRPPSISPSTAANCVAGAGLPSSADGSFEGSPVCSAKANSATSAPKISTGAITQPSLPLRADAVPSAPGCMSVSSTVRSARSSAA